jgi:hypothetical protein
MVLLLLLQLPSFADLNLALQSSLLLGFEANSIFHLVLNHLEDGLLITIVEIGEIDLSLLALELGGEILAKSGEKVVDL